MENVEETLNPQRTQVRNFVAVVLAVHEIDTSLNKLSAVIAPREKKEEVRQKWGFEGKICQRKLASDDEVHFCVPLPDQHHLLLEDSRVW